MGPGLVSQEGEGCCCFSAGFVSSVRSFCSTAARGREGLKMLAENLASPKEGIGKEKRREVFGNLAALSHSAPSPVLRALHKQRKSALHQMFSKRQYKNNWFSRLSLTVTVISGYCLQGCCRYMFFRWVTFFSI